MESLNFDSARNTSSAMLAPYGEAYWIISEAIIAFVGCYFLYLFFALSVYARKRKPQKEKRNLLIMTIISAGFAIGRVISDEFVAFLGWQKDSFCVYAVSFSIGLYYFSFVAVYVFLWTRQNYFYQKPLLRKLVNKKLLHVSRATLTVLVVLGVIVVTLFQIPEVTGWDYRATSTGCRDNQDEQDFELFPLFLVIVTVIGQIALLGLLIYPFVVTRNQRNRLDTGSQLWIPRPPSPSKSENPLLRRAVLASYQEKIANSAGSTRAHQNVGKDFATPSMQQLSQIDDEVFASDAGDLKSDSSSCFSSSELDSEMENKGASSKRVNLIKKYRKKRKLQCSGSETSAVEFPEFLKPIVQKKTLKKKSKRKRNRKNSQAKRAKELSQLIKKVFFLALTCVVSDVLTTMIQLILVVPELPYLALYDVNLAINITCIIISFKDWRSMICPCAYPLKSNLKTKSQERRDSAKPIISKKAGKASNATKKAVNFPSPSRFASYVEALEDDIVSLHSTTSAATNESTSRSVSPEHTSAPLSAKSTTALFGVFGKPTHSVTKV